MPRNTIFYAITQPARRQRHACARSLHGENCDYYKADRIVRIAYGMEHTFDKVLATDIARIRGTLVRHFGNGSYYVRRNGKKGITPAEQEYINSIFIAYGYTEGACFDNYKDEGEW